MSDPGVPLPVSLGSRRPLALVIATLGLSAACSDGDGPGVVGGLDGNSITWEGPVPGLDGGRDVGGDGPGGDGRPDGGPGDAETRDASPDAGTDPCLAPPEASVTPARAVADPSLLGRVIEVRGRLGPGPLECTREPCGADEPCCQSCAAPMRLDDVLLLRSSDCRDALIGCGGSNCSTTCSPPVLGGTIRVVGRLAAGDDGPTLEVWSLVR